MLVSIFGLCKLGVVILLKEFTVDHKYINMNKDSYNKQYYELNKDKIKQRVKEWRNQNKEQSNDYLRKYREENKERIKQYHDIYNVTNSEKNKAAASRYYDANREKCIERAKTRYKEKKDVIKIKGRERYALKKRELNKKNLDWQRKQWKTNPDYRLRYFLRGRLYNALNVQSVKKCMKTFELIGCSIDYLKKHLELQFTEGMCWENYGYRGWHIDHIKPCNTFDLSNTDQQKQCFHYTNLRPLWSRDNLSRPKDGSDLF
ncbi:hypothetical protein EBZ39_00845 [bacterium]|nr:hypothetical protein [bacterium]